MFRRILKFALISLGGLLLLVVAASLSLHVLISQHDHQFIKDQVARRVADATGYTLQIEGSLELPYTLLPTVVLNDIVFNARAPADGPSLLTADSLRVTIAILPLLKNQLRIDDTTLTNANLHFEFDAAGQANWIPENPPDGRESDTSVAVHAINFEQIDIQFVDQRVDVEIGARIDELSLRAPADETFMDVALTAEFEGLPVQVQGRISARANAFAGLEHPVSLNGTIRDMAFTADGHIDRVVGAPIDELGFFAKLHLEGSDMDAFSEVTGLLLPPTSSFVIDGDVEGRPGAIVARNVDGVLKKDGLTLVASGVIGQLSRFDELDLAATIVGDDLRDVPYFDEGELPATDMFEISANVRGDWPAFNLNSVVASAKRNDISATATGQLADTSNFGGADLNVGLDGTSLAELGELAAMFDMPKLNTDAFRGSGRLRGSWPTMSVDDADINLERGDISLRMRGSLRDAKRVTGLNVRVDAIGSDLAAIPELEKLALPSTDRFSVQGIFAGDLERLSARDMVSTARRGAHEVTIVGAVADIGGLSGIEMDVSAKGTDMYELNDVFAPDFPHTERYEITSALTGNYDTLASHDLSLQGSVPGLDLRLSGSIGTINEVRDVDVRGEIVIRNPSEFSEWSGIGLPEGEEIQLNGHMTGTAPNFDLSDLTYKSGESLVHGTTNMIVGDKLSFSGAVTSGQLDIRPFLQTAHGELAEPDDVGGERLFSDDPFDFSWLDAVDLDFSLRNLELIRTGEYARVPVANIVVQDGSLKIDPVEMTHEESRLEGHLIIDRSAEPVIDADLSLENIDLSKFLEDVRLRDFYEGNFDFALDVSMQGNTVSEMAANLDGDLAFFISDASIAGVDLRLRITDVLLGTLPWLTKEDDVHINCAMSEMIAEDGIVDVRLLYVDAVQMRLIGGGSIDLGNETYDLRLAPRPRGTRLFAHNIDLLVTGPMTDPQYTTTGAAKTVATNYGKYALLGPVGLLVPTERPKKHPCIGSLQEYRDRQETMENEQ